MDVGIAARSRVAFERVERAEVPSARNVGAALGGGGDQAILRLQFLLDEPLVSENVAAIEPVAVLDPVVGGAVEMDVGERQPSLASASRSIR
jgi:hypothetical protein